MLRALRIPIGWPELIKRTLKEVVSDNCLGLAAQLAYYFFLALFPALLFMVALIGFFPVGDVMSAILTVLGRVAPADVLAIIKEQVTTITEARSGGLLTLGALGALWSMSAGVGAIIDTLNQTYGIRESRPWWKVRLIAVGLTAALALFVVAAFGLLLGGPALGERVADWFRLGAVFTWSWHIAQWPVIFSLIALAFAIVYHFAPDGDREWIWITPGSVVGTIVWLAISLAFRLYVTNVANYNATYGAIGGVIVLMLWFYCAGLAMLLGAEVNAEAARASGKHAARPAAVPVLPDVPVDRGARPAPGALAAAHPNCSIDDDGGVPVRVPRATDWIVSGVVLSHVALRTFARLRARVPGVADR